MHYVRTDNAESSVMMLNYNNPLASIWCLNEEVSYIDI